MDRKVVAPEVLLESKNQLKSETAKREAQKSAVEKAEADLLAKKAVLERALLKRRKEQQKSNGLDETRPQRKGP